MGLCQAPNKIYICHHHHQLQLVCLDRTLLPLWRLKHTDLHAGQEQHYALEAMALSIKAMA